MVRAEISVVINRSAEDIFPYLSEVQKAPEWQSGILEANQLSDGPPAVGTTSREVRHIFGRRLETTFEITEFEPHRKLSFKSTSGPFAMQGRYTLVPTEGGTRVTFVLEGKISGILKMAEPIVLGTAKRQMDTDFGNLKVLLEA